MTPGSHLPTQHYCILVLLFVLPSYYCPQWSSSFPAHITDSPGTCVLHTHAPTSQVPCCPPFTAPPYIAPASPPAPASYLIQFMSLHSSAASDISVRLAAGTFVNIPCRTLNVAGLYPLLLSCCSTLLDDLSSQAMYWLSRSLLVHKKALHATGDQIMR
jgi:hypothetical protein